MTPCVFNICVSRCRSWSRMGCRPACCWYLCQRRCHHLLWQWVWYVLLNIQREFKVWIYTISFNWSIFHVPQPKHFYGSSSHDHQNCKCNCKRKVYGALFVAIIVHCHYVLWFCTFNTRLCWKPKCNSSEWAFCKLSRISTNLDQFICWLNNKLSILV